MENILKRKCKQCLKEFEPRSHGGTKEFCSHTCANTHTWKTRERITRKIIKRTCRQCGKEYEKSRKYSLSQWSQNKYCSQRCSADAKKIRDGMTKDERRRRRLGKPKQGTPEWRAKISSTTKSAMLKPEIKWKLSQPRSPMSLEARIKHSNALAGKLPKNMMFGANNDVGLYANVQRGEYENSKGTMYFRSKWEANYAIYLDFLIRQGQIKEWEYEADVFVFEEIQFGTRSYRPDFKVFTNDGLFEYHEVKGYMDGPSKTKLKRMAKYYPDVKLILIDAPVYNEIKKKLGKLLNFN